MKVTSLWTSMETISKNIHGTLVGDEIGKGKVIERDMEALRMKIAKRVKTVEVLGIKDV